MSRATMVVPSAARECPEHADATLGDGAAAAEPPNGAEVFRLAEPTGLGSLRIANGTATGAAVKLVATTERLHRWVYIRAGQEVTLSGIRVGVYRLLFSTGRAWDPSKKIFVCDRSNTEFDDALVFEEKQEESSTVYDNFSVTLHQVRSGNASTHGLADDAFDRIGSG